MKCMRSSMLYAMNTFKEDIINTEIIPKCYLTKNSRFTVNILSEKLG